MKQPSRTSGDQPPAGMDDRPPWHLLGLVVLVLAACLGAAAPWSLAHGVLFMAAGGIMMVFTPHARAWPLVIPGVACLACCLAGFLPAAAVDPGAWREEFRQAGLIRSDLVTPQPMESAVLVASMAATGLVAVWALGLGIGPHGRMVGACLAVVVVLVYTLADLTMRAWSAVPAPDFGFFPNRNHSAALLAMGLVAAFGLFVQSLRDRWPVLGGFSVVALLWFAGCLLVRSQSRAGIVLLLPAFLFWIALVGRNYLRGNSGKAALLLLLAGALAFLAADTSVKQRIDDTMGRLGTFSSAAEPAREVAEIDGRIGMAGDTAGMIASMPWTGCGAGQFRFIFPQFRTATVAVNDSTAYHPESSWLWIASEFGIPAMLAMAGLAGWVVFRATKGLREPGARQRVLRAACLAAGTIPLVHGFFDVSPHRVGVFWAGAALLALSLPTAGASLRPFPQAGWRLAGLAVMAWGACLLRGHLRDEPLLPSEHAGRLADQAHAAYLAEYRVASGEQPAPPATGQPDPLEVALDALRRAGAMSPLDPRVHGLTGMIALHFDDKDDLARRSFAIQRQLDPVWLRLPLLQAHAWAPIDPAETELLWQDALRRASTLESRLPGRPWRAQVENAIIQQASRYPHLAEGAARIQTPDRQPSGGEND